MADSIQSAPGRLRALSRPGPFLLLSHAVSAGIAYGSLACAVVAVPLPELCEILPLESVRIELDQRPVYVAPEGIATKGDTVVVLGAPAMVWESAGDRWARAPDSIAGVLVVDGVARPIRPPSPVGADTALAFRVAAREGRGWDVVFSSMPSPGDRSAGSPRLWAGRLSDAGTWSSIQALDLPEGLAEFEPGLVSPLADEEDARIFAFSYHTVGAESRTAIYEQTPEGWRLVELPRPAAYLVPFHDARGELRLLTSHGDVVVPGVPDHNTLVLYRVRPWSRIGVLTTSEDEPAHHPVVLEVEDGRAVVWRRAGSGGSPSDVRVAWAGLESAATIVDSPARWFSARSGDGEVIVVTATGDDRDAELRFFSVRGERVRPLGSQPTMLHPMTFRILASHADTLTILGASIPDEELDNAPPHLRLEKVARRCPAQ